MPVIRRCGYPGTHDLAVAGLRPAPSLGRRSGAHATVGHLTPAEVRSEIASGHLAFHDREALLDFATKQLLARVRADDRRGAHWEDLRAASRSASHGVAARRTKRVAVTWMSANGMNAGTTTGPPHDDLARLRDRDRRALAPVDLFELFAQRRHDASVASARVTWMAPGVAHAATPLRRPWRSSRRRSRTGVIPHGRIVQGAHRSWRDAFGPAFRASGRPPGTPEERETGGPTNAQSGASWSGFRVPRFSTPRERRVTTVGLEHGGER